MAAMLDKARITVIGAGNLGSALLSGLAEAGVSADGLCAADASAEQRKRIESDLKLRTSASNRKAIDGADVVVLAVKPHLVGPVVAEIAADLKPKQLLISLAAAVEIAALESHLSRPQPIVRAMPNIAMTVHAAATAFCKNDAAQASHLDLAREIFEAVGETVLVGENQMHAVTALSGSGPAYVFLVAEALTAGGVKCGLAPEAALKLAAQTLLGAAEMILESGLHPAALKDQVTTPGGTTIFGLGELEQHGVRGGLMAAVDAANERSLELAELLRDR